MTKRGTHGQNRAASTTRSAAQQRADVALALNRILTKNRTIDQVLVERPQPPAGLEMLYGTLRYLPGLQQLIARYVHKPLREKDSDISALLLVGTYQLIFMRTPDHATIHETVEACKHLKKSWATGLLNAVLRKLAKDQHTKQSFNPADQFPEWMVSLLSRQYGSYADSLLSANLQRAPMSLRINHRATDTADYLLRLEDRRLSHRQGPFPESVILDQPISSSELPGYQAGQVSIQDLGAQWAGRLLLETIQVPQPSDVMQPYDCHILDACAAPGGKLFHLLEQLPEHVDVAALEVNPSRAEQTRTMAERLGHRCNLIVGDARKQEWWSGRLFSHILLDAPCSGSGTLRRHPDIKRLLRSDRLDAHRDLQLELLNNLWSILRPGGTLLYCTCSLFEQENDQVIEAFVAQQAHAQSSHAEPIHDSLELPTGRATRYGWQLLPTDPDTDGFYFARLSKPVKYS